MNFFRYFLIKTILFSSILLVAFKMQAMDTAGMPLQGVTITGTVVDESGVTLPGVNITVRGTVIGTVSDPDGKYSISVPDRDAVLVFSFLGHGTREIVVGDRNIIDVTMQESTSEMDEVIVVAYGTQRRSSVTGSIATLRATELTTVTAPSVNSMLQGKVAGVQVLNQSGRPGETPVIRIRGKSSLGGDTTIEPLWVIDGVVSGTGAQLNPNEIESMSVLKDATATALYGSRATNGVIIVTTKGGRAGENYVTASAKVGISKQNLGNFRLMNGPELYDYSASMVGAFQLYPWMRDKDELLASDFDWFDFATQTGVSQNYTLSHTFGTDRMRNFFSFDYYKETGTVKGFEFDRFSFRDNMDITVNDRLRVNLRLAGSYRTTFDQQHDIYSAMTYLPWDYPINTDGSIRSGRESGMGTALNWHGRDQSNYYYTVGNDYAYTRNMQFGTNGNFGLNYRILDWLMFESNNNIGLRFSREMSYADPRNIGADGGRVVNISGMVTTRYTNQLLRINHFFNRVHYVSAFLGYEYSDYTYETSRAEGQSIPANGEVLAVAANPYRVDGSKNENATQSVFFNANYIFNDKYSAQFSFRRDGSSKFGPENRAGNFWTVGAAWSVEKENFMRNISAIDYLKLRASYGSVGNSASLGNYDYLSTFNIGVHYDGVPGVFPNRLGNPELTWEKCYATNLGFDVGVFNRLNLTFEYYVKNTSDLLQSRPLSAAIYGFTSRFENVGSLKNTGVELNLSGEILKIGDFVWSAGANLGYNRNEITELPNDNEQQIYGDRVFRVGHDRDAFFLPEWAGVEVYTGAPLWYAYDEGGNRTVVTDISQASRILIGTSTPKYTGGINTSFSYKGITLSALGIFSTGNMIYHYARIHYDNDGAYPQYNSMSLSHDNNWSRWEKPGDIATHPQAIAGGNNNSNLMSTRFLEKGDFFKLSNVTLSYDLPGELVSRALLKNARIYVSGENLLTVTQFSGADVEAGSGNSGGNYDTALYPTVRRFSVGINLSF